MIQDLINNEFFESFIILVSFFILATIIHFISKKYIKKLTEKTISDADDITLNIITKPLYIFIIFLGLYLGIKSLTILEEYFSLIDKIAFVFAVLIIAFVISRILSMFIGKWLKVKKRFAKTPQLFNKIVSVIVYIIAILMILDFFNVEITPLVATLGLGGLAVGLALQNTLTNFFAGLHIISDRPINVNDYIELPDANISGYVEDIGWRSTRIRTLPNTIVIVPNSKLAESIVINDSLPQQEMAALVQVGVDYGSNLKKVEKVTIDVARKIQKTVKGAVKNFEPFIRYHTFGDSNINFTVILRVETFVDKYLVTHEFIKALKERYDKEKIEISWPVRKIYRGK